MTFKSTGKAMAEKKGRIPDQMQAVRQKKAGGPLSLETVEVPRPGRGEVLIQMDSSPINPSDLSLIRGGYLERDYPFTPGLEGSGIVVASGGGIFAQLRMGKRVACSPLQGGDGTWAEYMVTSAMHTAPLPRTISLEQGSMMLVNPMTAMAFLHLAGKGKHRAMVNNAAASSLGLMLIRLCRRRGIPLINVVRKEAQLESLKQLGATHVLNSQSPTFPSDLKQLAGQLNATLFLDAVGGSQSDVLLKAAPEGSTLMIYARLSGEPVLTDPGELILHRKQLVGFQLGNFLNAQSLLFTLRFLHRVKRHLGAELASHVRSTLPLARMEEAVAEYRQHMSGGKIILKM
jgi:NADPH2:quinone reductase